MNRTAAALGGGVMSLDHLADHPCHGACDDGSIALEIWGDDWRVLLCLEPDPAESGWSWVRINPGGMVIGGLDDRRA
jgi:hypothetical protein